MDLGWLDLGYDLKDGTTGLVLAGPQAWYGHKVAGMVGVTSAQPEGLPRSPVPVSAPGR